jgi:hypothetical protein
VVAMVVVDDHNCDQSCNQMVVGGGPIIQSSILPPSTTILSLTTIPINDNHLPPFHPHPITNLTTYDHLTTNHHFERHQPDFDDRIPILFTLNHYYIKITIE